MRILLAAALLLGAAAPAGADRDLCAPGAKHHGAPVDLDVKDADVHDVFRLLADVGRVNLVVADDVAGKVTLRLKHVPWDQVACAVGSLQHLWLVMQDTILMVTPARAADHPSTR